MKAAFLVKLLEGHRPPRSKLVMNIPHAYMADRPGGSIKHYASTIYKFSAGIIREAS